MAVPLPTFTLDLPQPQHVVLNARKCSPHANLPGLVWAEYADLIDEHEQWKKNPTQRERENMTDPGWPRAGPRKQVGLHVQVSPDGQIYVRSYGEWVGTPHKDFVHSWATRDIDDYPPIHALVSTYMANVGRDQYQAWTMPSSQYELWGSAY